MIGLYLLLAIIFVVVLAVAGVVCGAIMTAFDNAAPQITVALLALAVFLVGYGTPFWIAVGIAVLMYVQCPDQGLPAAQDRRLSWGTSAPQPVPRRAATSCRSPLPAGRPGAVRLA